MSFPVHAMLAVAGLSIMSSACTVVRIEGAGSVSTHFGVLRIAPADRAGVVVVSSRGFGLVPTSNGLVVGGSSEHAVYLSDASDCRAVFFIENDTQAENLLAQLRATGVDAKTICESKEKKP